MLLILRCLTLAIMLVLGVIIASLVCVVRPRHRNNVHMLAKIFSFAAPVLGLKVIVRNSIKDNPQPCVFLANHQNNFDIFTHTAAVPKGTVSLGKKSIAWMPLIGQIYWLTGNIFLDRRNRNKAFATMAQAAEKIKKKCLSIWVFPEGTRSQGRGLLPFKMGAFHTAISAGVPMVPVLASNQCHINLNRWNNGVVIIEMMQPINTQGVDQSQVKELSARIHALMAEKLALLNKEASALMAKAAC